MTSDIKVKLVPIFFNNGSNEGQQTLKDIAKVCGTEIRTVSDFKQVEKIFKTQIEVLDDQIKNK